MTPITSRVLAVYRDALGDARDQSQLQTLTEREREILTLIGSGLTNNEIAANLFISAGTVKTHVNHIFSKLNLRHRADAVIFGFDHGLVTRHNR